MNIREEDTVWLDDRYLCSLEELARHSGLAPAELRALAELGVLAPAPGASAEPRFYASCIVTVRTARRLRDDFELDLSGLGVVLQLLQRVERLEHALAEAGARLHGG